LKFESNKSIITLSTTWGIDWFEFKKKIAEEVTLLDSVKNPDQPITRSTESKT